MHYLKPTILCLLAVVCSTTAIARHKLKPRKYYVVKADTMNARAEEGFNGEILKTFKKGDKVMVLKLGTMTTIKGKRAPWCDIGYRVGNSEHRGVVWSGYFE